MIEQVKEFCRQKQLLCPGDRVVVGLSGGADSVCLFLILSELAKEWKLTLYPVHVNHNLRGEAADKDEAFCRSLCEEHGWELSVALVQVEALAAEYGWSVEEAGRNVRYETFRKVAEEKNCNRIAVAHHKNDQAETVLFQLFRGSRVKGLSGMQEKNGNVIRPLLCVCRKEIEEFLQKKKQDFCIDHTNFEEEYTRNLIRGRILPVAEQVSCQAVEHIAATADYMQQVERYLQLQTERLYQKAVTEGPSCVRILIPALEEEDGLLGDRVLYEAICRASGGRKDITAGYVVQCRELCTKQTGRQIDLPGGLYAKKNYSELWIGRAEKNKPELCVVIDSFPFRAKNPTTGETWQFTLHETDGKVDKFIEKMGGIPNCTYTKWFDYDKIKNSVLLRTVKTEDEIILYTDGRGKRVMDVLADAKIPKEKRLEYPVLAEGKQVLWIPGIRNSEGYRITMATKRILIVKTDGGNEDGR